MKEISPFLSKLVARREVLMMRDYIKVEVVTESDIEKYLSNGWEIIDKAKGHLGSDRIIAYHIGLPVREQMKRLEEIIKDYELFGFKEKLFEKIAEKNNQSVEDYSNTGGYITSAETAKYMEKYDFV